MAIFAIVSLFITLTLFCCFLLPPPFISSVAAAKERSKLSLVDQVCQSTPDFNFCNHTIYSDPRAPTEDRIVLTYIAFDAAYLYATNTQEQVQLKITENEGGKSKIILDGLKSCMDYYTDAIRVLSEALGNLDSESYFNLDKMSTKVQDDAHDCEKGFDSTTGSPMTKENVDLIKHTDICYAVAMLFKY